MRAGRCADDAEARVARAATASARRPERTRGPSRAQEEAFAAWRRFLEALAEEHPLVLVFEDLHWADDALLDFVDQLVEGDAASRYSSSRTARPELLQRRSGMGRWQARTRSTISLSRSPTTETARLLVKRCSSGRCSTADLQEAAARAGRRQPALRGGVRAHARASARRMCSALPETVQGIIAARLDTLSRARRGCSRTQRCVGKVFWLGAVEAVDGVARWQARGACCTRSSARSSSAAHGASSVAGETRVRVPAPARPRRRVRPDPARARAEQAPARRRLDRVARPARGSGRDARPSLPAGARARGGGRAGRGRSCARARPPRAPGRRRPRRGALRGRRRRALLRRRAPVVAGGCRARRAPLPPGCSRRQPRRRRGSRTPWPRRGTPCSPRRPRASRRGRDADRAEPTGSHGKARAAPTSTPGGAAARRRAWRAGPRAYGDAPSEAREARAVEHARRRRKAASSRAAGLGRGRERCAEHARSRAGLRGRLRRDRRPRAERRACVERQRGLAARVVNTLAVAYQVVGDLELAYRARLESLPSASGSARSRCSAGSGACSPTTTTGAASGARRCRMADELLTGRQRRDRRTCRPGRSYAVRAEMRRRDGRPATGRSRMRKLLWRVVARSRRCQAVCYVLAASAHVFVDRITNASAPD